jgi:hypothetical protein
MRFVAPIAALLLSTSAHAGGIGPMVVGGFHTEPLYYYSATTDGTAGGSRFQSPTDYDQFKVSQAIGNIGAGLELVLGDRDDFIQGTFRAYWQLDTPQIDPSKSSDLVDAEVLVADWRENARHTGVGTVGLQVGVVRAAADKFKFGISAHVGAGFISPNHNEFFLGQLGTNINYQITPTLEAYLDVTYALRIRKQLSHGVLGTAGLRILFD